jgi:DNA-binding NtrC family response regulator
MANVLVVDDEIGIRELLSEILADEGHVVFTAENASVARSVRQSEALDLVLLDIWMPDTDGVTLLKEWAAGGQLTMPVLMMSGHATIDTAVEATRYGAMDFLEKPIALARLLSAVKTALDRGRIVSSMRAALPVEPAPVPVQVPASPVWGGVGRLNRGLVAVTADAPSDVPDESNTVSLDQPLREARDHFERVYFEYHLERERYSMTRVADKSGLERTHLYRKLKQLGIELSRGGRRSDRGAHGLPGAEAGAPSEPVADSDAA